MNDTTPKTDSDRCPKRGLATRLIHGGEPQPRTEGAVAAPIFQSSTFEYGGDEGYHDLKYIRLNNTPTHRVLHDKLARAEGAEAGLATASGMAAITAALLTVLEAGDHLIAQNTLYGGTHDFLTQDLPRFGIEVSFIDGDAPDSWERQVRETTKAIYVETLSNPLLDMPDLEASVAFARRHGLVSMIDNTFASPVAYQPCPAGFDLSLHSATKYLNGHSDIVAGAVIGSRSRVEAVRRTLNHLGGSLDPHAVYLLYRGMKTLELRYHRQSSNALRLARFLDTHPAVTQVNYPGLESHPRHERAKALLSAYGGMLSFELEGGTDAAERTLSRLELPIVAPSLGGVESLATRPATSSHAGMTAEDRAAAGISDGLIRVSVGIETEADLLADFEQALA